MTDARRTALDALVRMQDGMMDTETGMSGANGIADLADRDRAFAASLVHNTLRWGRAADALLARYIDKPIPAKRLHVHWALRMGVVQLLVMDVPAHAAVSTTVSLIKLRPHEKVFAGLANAVLKKILKDAPTLSENAALPEWMLARWVEFYGADAAQAMASQIAQTPTLDITVPNDRASYAALWNGELIGAHTVRLPLCDVRALAGYDEGAWWVQDVASTIPVQMLGDVAGKRVLDLCAAPGGKTAQLCAGGAVVTAVDRSPSRLKRLRENMARLGFSPTIIEADVMAWETGLLFDTVMLDAPCSASGTLRRHPEMSWQRKESQVPELAALQARLLHRAWGYVAPHGRLLYAVCSLEREEGEAQIAEFLGHRKDARLVRVTLPDLACPAQANNANGTMRLLPHYWGEAGGMDGFFAALIEKV